MSARLGRRGRGSKMPITGPQFDSWKWKGKNAGGLKTAAEIDKQ